MRSLPACLSLALLAQCGPEAPSGPASLVPSNYATNYVEVRRCRSTLAHHPNPSGDVVRILRVWVSPVAASALTLLHI